MTDNFKPTSFIKQPPAGVPAPNTPAVGLNPAPDAGMPMNSGPAPKSPKKIFGMEAKSLAAVLGLTLFFVVAMGGVAISLRQRVAQGPAAPTAPQSRPQADVGQIGSCSLFFDAEPVASPYCTSISIVGNADPSSATSLTFSCAGAPGSDYYFFSYRTDRNGALQLLSSGPDATSSAISMAGVNYLHVQCNPHIGANGSSATSVNENCNYEFTRGATPTPSPSVTPTPTPTVSPSVTPTPTPTPSSTPGVTPSPTYSCNSSCSTNAQCATANSNFICSNGSCRLSSNPSSTTCSTVGCNEVCSSNSDCSNTSHICSGGRCRLDSNPDSSTCTPPSTTTTTTTTTVAQQTGTPSQPTLPAELPQTGAEDFGTWLKAGVVILLGGAALLLFL